jgi:hypothetical protein
MPNKCELVHNHAHSCRPAVAFRAAAESDHGMGEDHQAIVEDYRRLERVCLEQAELCVLEDPPHARRCLTNRNTAAFAG